MADTSAPREDLQSWSVPRDAVAASITQSPEALVVTFIGAHDERSSLSFRRMKLTRLERRHDDLFSCGISGGEPRLSFPFTPASHETAVAQGIYAGGSDTFVFLRKAVDGALIVQLRTESAGLSLFVIGTHFTFDTVWLRYPPLVQGR